MMEAKEIAEIAKKRAEVSKELEKAKRKLETQSKMLESRVNFGKELGSKSIDVKYAAKEVAKLNKELDKLK